MKKNYLLGIVVMGLIVLSLYSTYAMFTESVETDEIINLSASTINLNSEIVEYEQITINGNEAKSIMVNISNSTESNLYYGVWYEMVNPASINDNIEIAKLTSSTDSTQGTINTGVEKNVKIVIKNTGSSSITVNIGVGYSKTSSLDLPTNRYVITNEIQGKYIINTSVISGSTTNPTKIVDVGNSTNITVTPSTGYKYKSISCTNAEASYNTGNNTLTLTNIIDDVSCTVTNEIITYNVGVTASTGGTVSGSSSKTVNYNGSTTFIVIPSTGYKYSSVSCPSGITGSYSTSTNTLTVSSVKASGTCTVNFTPKTYTVTVSVTNGISSPTSRIVIHGSSTTFTVTPNSGYEYESLSCTGGSYNQNTKVLTVSNVTSAITCTIKFKKSLPPASEYIESLLSSNPNAMANDDPDGNIRYMGSNPNNYVSFNNELWRIIGVFNVKSSTSGSTEKRLKIIRNSSIGSMPWDNGNRANNWTNATINKYLNSTYLTTINSTYQSMIENTYWNLGGSSSYEDATASMFYTRERGTAVYNGNPTYWVGKIGLMYPSDYGYATSGGTFYSRSECLNMAIYNWNSITDYMASECYKNDYLYDSNNQNNYWTLMHYTISSDYVFFTNYGTISSENVWTSYQIKPVLYLKSSVSITGGTGTSTNPYTLSI